jgi:hypothetical protein
MTERQGFVIGTISILRPSICANPSILIVGTRDAIVGSPDSAEAVNTNSAGGVA